MRRVGVHGAGFTPITQMAPCPAGAVAGDWWDPNNDGLCVWAAYQPKGAADLAGSYVDLSGNGNNTAPGVAPTWDAVNGWIFNGTTQYLVTTFVPAQDQSQSMIIQYTNAVTIDGVICGCNGLTTTRVFHLEPLRSGTSVRYGNGGLTAVAPQLAAGNICVAGNDGYRNGASEGIALAAWTGAALTVYIGARHSTAVGGANNFCQSYVQAFAIYDCTLTAPQVAAVVAAMAAL